MPDFTKKVRIDAVAIRETRLALLCDVGEHEPRWIPKSQIDDESQISEAGETGELVISEWFAVKEGLA